MSAGPSTAMLHNLHQFGALCIFEIFAAITGITLDNAPIFVFLAIDKLIKQSLITTPTNPVCLV